MAHPHLKEIYTRENPLQAMNATAARIERETGIAVVRCHLGNPRAPQFEESNKVVGEYFLARSQDPASGTGYADVIGHASWRQVIANALTRINRLPPGSITKDNIRGANGGTGALNVVFQIFEDPTILVSDPFYPPWMEIARHTKERKIETFGLAKDYLLDADILSRKIDDVNARTPDKPVVLIYHYPHNPTGKTLTQGEAKTVGERLNQLCAKYPNLYLVQEDLYLATTAADMGIHTPLPYLDENAKSRTIWLHSPSKMGHAQDRGAVIAAFDKDILHHLRGCISFDTLGPSHASLLATANTLVEIADGGVDAIGAEGSRPDNYRYKTADFYQERLKIVADGIRKIEEKLAVEILPGGTPKGTYYLYPSFGFLKGQDIPAELKPVFGTKKTFENADDVALALQNAHLMGLQPVTAGSGSLFTRDKDTMHLRLSTIEPHIGMMQGADNTLRGLVQKTMHVDLGAYFHSQDELRAQHPAQEYAQGAVQMEIGRNLMKVMKGAAGFTVRQ